MVPDIIFLLKILHPASKVYTIFIQVLITSDRVARLQILKAHQIGLIDTFVTKCYLMVTEAIFLVKFNTRLEKKYENHTIILITPDRVARLSIFIGHQIGLIKTFVTRCYLMVLGTRSIVKFNTRFQKSMNITLKY